MVFLEGPPRTPLRRPKVPKITQEEHRVAPRPPQGLPHRVPRCPKGSLEDHKISPKTPEAPPGLCQWPLGGPQEGPESLLMVRIHPKAMTNH